MLPRRFFFGGGVEREEPVKAKISHISGFQSQYFSKIGWGGEQKLNPCKMSLFYSIGKNKL